MIMRGVASLGCRRVSTQGCDGPGSVARRLVERVQAAYGLLPRWRPLPAWFLVFAWPPRRRIRPDTGGRPGRSIVLASAPVSPGPICIRCRDAALPVWECARVPPVPKIRRGRPASARRPPVAPANGAPVIPQGIAPGVLCEGCRGIARRARRDRPALGILTPRGGVGPLKPTRAALRARPPR